MDVEAVSQDFCVERTGRDGQLVPTVLPGEALLLL